MIERTKIANGVHYNAFQGGGKKDKLIFLLSFPLARETLTESALLPYLLTRGTKKLPDMTALKRRQKMLYGAEIGVSSSTMDFVRQLSLSIEGVNPRYLTDADSLHRDRARLLLDVLLDPALVDGAFYEEWIDIEREKLRMTIEAEKNNKRQYCLTLAARRFFENDARSLPRNGFPEDLEAIDGKRLFEVWRWILRHARVEIFDSAPDPAVFQELSAAFSKQERNPLVLPEQQAVSSGEVERETIVQDTEQSKYALIFTADRLPDRREQTVLRLANLLFGGAPTSRLFLNVREKKSLCYYCASNVGYLSGSLTVDSGIEEKDALPLEEAVLYEIADLASKNITAQELDEMKLLLVNALQSTLDTVDSAMAWHIGCFNRLGIFVSPSEEIELVKQVSVDDIAEALKRFRLKTAVLLAGKRS